MQQAEGEWRTAARLVPSFVEAQRALATVAQRRSDWDLLWQCGEQLIRAQANSPEGYVDLATAQIGRGDSDSGEKEFAKSPRGRSERRPRLHRLREFAGCPKAPGRCAPPFPTSIGPRSSLERRLARNR